MSFLTVSSNVLPVIHLLLGSRLFFVFLFPLPRDTAGLSIMEQRYWSILCITSGVKIVYSFSGFEGHGGVQGRGSESAEKYSLNSQAVMKLEL